jgi:hypothetical protein
MLTDEILSVTSEQMSDEERILNLEVPHCIHHSEIESLIQCMINGAVEPERVASQLVRHLDVYLEQPFLLDPYLISWIPALVGYLRGYMEEPAWDRIAAASKILYTICKVRGTKSVLVHFKHSVDDVVPLLKFTNLSLTAELGAVEGWMTRFIAMHMASLVLLIPFDFDKFQRRFVEVGCPDLLEITTAKVMERLQCGGRERQAAVMFMAALLCRPDNTSRLANFINKSIRLVTEEPLNCIGTLECVCAIVKNLKAEPHFVELSDLLNKIDEMKPDNSLIRRCRIKLYNRLAGVIDVSRCMNVQIVGLGDSDTVVRWAAAKGVAKLVKMFDGATVNRILDDLLNALERDTKRILPDPTTCHGISLAFAEISRLAVIPLERISVILSWACYLLRFEVPRGRFAAGTAVRDAACYIVWALCRSYPVQDAAEQCDRLAGVLTCVSLFDREVSCRRAASAAFQELVGRWTNIPHGIALLSSVDFFTTHNQRHTFGVLAAEIATRFPEYRPAIIEHLHGWSIGSWDREIRQLAAPLLAKLMNRTDMNELVPNLLSASVNPEDLGLQHGSILTLASLVEYVDDVALLESILPVSYILVNAISPKMLGWELICSAVCQLIGSLAQSRSLIPMSAETVSIWLSSITMALQSRDDSLHKLAVMGPLSTIVEHQADNSNIISDYFRGVVLPAADKDRNVNAQRGFTLALSAMPGWLFKGRFEPVCRLLFKWISDGVIERRVNAIHSAGALIRKLDFIPNEDGPHDQLLQAMLAALEDYSIDSRGDIGSLLRLAAMQELPKAIGSRLAVKSMLTGALVRHLVDKLDKLRVEAIQILKAHSGLNLPFDKLEESAYNPKHFFASLSGYSMELLAYEADLFIGLISSAGSVNILIVNNHVEKF